MNVSSVTSSDYLSYIFGIQATDTTQSSTQTSASSFFSSGSDQANISPMGKLMSSLSQLQSSDPDKFKKLAQQISDDLADQAENASDPMSAKMLSDMSSNFATAAQTGEMSSLRPKGPPPPPPSGSSSGTGKTGGDDAMSTAESVIAKDLSAATGQTYSLSGSSSTSGAGNLGEMLKLLTQMQATDPEKFKALTKQISEDLAAKAKTSTDERESGMLTKMSSDFAEASSTGSTDSLKPKGPPPPPQFAGGFQNQQQGQSGYSSQSGQDPMSILSSILANDLSGLTSATMSSYSATV